jgi:hypothetical protein
MIKLALKRMQERHVNEQSINLLIDLGLFLQDNCLPLTEYSSYHFDGQYQFYSELAIDEQGQTDYIICQCSAFPNGEIDARTKIGLFHATVSEHAIDILLHTKGSWEQKFREMVTVCQKENQLRSLTAV